MTRNARRDLFRGLFWLAVIAVSAICIGYAVGIVIAFLWLGLGIAVVGGAK